MRHGVATACAGLAVAALAGGYLAGRQSWAAAALLAAGAVWTAAMWRGWGWAPGLGLLATAAAAAGGLAQELGAAWMVGGAVAALIAWDLAGLEGQLMVAAPGDDVTLVARHHLAWLAATLVAGLALAGAAVLIRLRLPLGWAMALALVAALGVGRLISRQRQ